MRAPLWRCVGRGERVALARHRTCSPCVKMLEKVATCGDDTGWCQDPRKPMMVVGPAGAGWSRIASFGDVCPTYRKDSRQWEVRVAARRTSQPTKASCGTPGQSMLRNSHRPSFCRFSRESMSLSRYSARRASRNS